MILNSEKKRKFCGAISLSALATLLLLVNFLMSSLPRQFSPSSMSGNIVWLGMGVVLSPVAMVTFWLVLRIEPLFQRLATVIFFALPLWSSFEIGAMIEYSSSENLYEYEWKSIYMRFSLVVFSLLGGLVPLTVAKVFGVRCLGDREESNQKKEGYSLAAILIVMIFVGAGVVCFQNGEPERVLNRDSNPRFIWWFLLMSLLTGVLLNLIVTLPRILIELHQRFTIRLLCNVMLLLLPVTICFNLELMKSVGGVYAKLLVVLTTTIFLFSWFLSSLKLLGYRVTRLG